MICADELGPVIPRTFPPAPAWSPDGHRIKAQLDYSRGPEKTWVYGGLRPADGQAVTMTASSRNSEFYQQFLQLIEDANPDGEIWIVTDNLSSHNSVSTRTWLEDHPRIHHAFIPVGACWLNLQEGWWRIFRKAALAGRSFANRDDIAAWFCATRCPANAAYSWTLTGTGASPRRSPLRAPATTQGPAVLPTRPAPVIRPGRHGRRGAAPCRPRFMPLSVVIGGCCRARQLRRRYVYTV
ncbi:transposase [Streptomyces sp. NPDC056462]|uniref:transposase n=1 Tax=Streptomyces sp. NPDC056462 TaxID=3345826 RepID=UPI0036A0BEC5